jgi:hypothetical protein
MQKDIFYSDLNLNKNKLRESWVKNNLDEYSIIKKFQIENKFDEIKFSNVLYNYINSINEIPLCNICNQNNKRFIGFIEGYNNFCSKKCASKASLKEALIKRKENTYLKYGVEHTSKLDFVKEKQKKTNLKNYGFVSPTQNKTIKGKQEKTMLDKYGVKFTGQSKILMDKVFSTRFDKYKNNLINRFPNLNIINIAKEGEVTIKCDKCLDNYKIKTDFLRLRYFRYSVETCLNCNPNKSYSFTGQNEIFNIFNDLGIETIKNDRSILSGKEIDIYLPKYNIAIEFNGLYWHSSLYKEKKYHLDKKEKCLEKGINLIHIWEDDWLYKKEIVKSRLLNLININETKIYARKCNIVEINTKKYRDFLNKNHLQGSINSSYSVGLEYNNELVSVMTFGKFRRSTGLKSVNKNWELYRFCSKLNVNVVGGFSKLLKYFETQINPENLITYANRDWSVNNNIYNNSNFEFLYNTEINYWYFDKNTKREHRFNFRKDKLIKQGFNINKTEKDIMFDRGYNIIYDCGSIKYQKNY